MDMDLLRGDDTVRKKPNTLPIWGNATTMNLNPLILTNIENSPYFKGRLQELKTYHEVVDEIYYKVNHLEPWEKGSRQTGGRRQNGMCGGVRGVGVGGIISSAFCLMYKLFIMRLTRNQVYGLVNHTDSPYIRGIGFLYIRFTQPPADFWEWYEPYIDDMEDIDVKAGGGNLMTMGQMIRHFITKLDWHSSLFPRIPVPTQIAIDKKLTALNHATSVDPNKPRLPPNMVEPLAVAEEQGETTSRNDESRSRSQTQSSSTGSSRRRSRSRSRSPRSKSDGRSSGRHSPPRRRRDRSRSRSPNRHRSSKYDKDRDRDRDRRSDRGHRSRDRDRYYDRR